MTDEEIKKVETYLRRQFRLDTITVNRSARADMCEVTIDGDFVGTLTSDEDEGEVSYNFVMAILDFDLEEAGL
ncbi:MAG: DUF3126 family protein [Parvibaculales bacterium]